MDGIHFAYNFSEDDFREVKGAPTQALRTFASQFHARFLVVDDDLIITIHTKGFDGDEEIPTISEKGALRVLGNPRIQRNLIDALGIYEATALLNAADRKATELKLESIPRIFEFRYKRVGASAAQNPDPSAVKSAQIFHL